ncbi:MAG: Trk system potassium transporter TrkA [Synergistaceae bacterium]|nr:Trk system potassium transporter TrkA [Synergistaceae bacterium]MBQ6419000.1 Trk system potassium transporter TrkA [Synergistaceae bacterium]MBQ6665742.1 Trk system potassium transporter TrkA [Synergistaceae bacterium]
MPSNVVIVGAGEVGRSVAKRLSSDGQNVYIVEKDEENAAEASDELDVEVIRGNGARPQVLALAGIVPGGDIDVFIACTNRDEVNMLSCWIAQNAGVPQVISRTRSLEFTDSPEWGRKLGIDAMISPERSIAREILGLVEVAGATHTAELLDRQAALYTLKISEDSPLNNTALKDIRQKFPKLVAVLVYVEHEDGVSGVPNGLTVLKAGDVCYAVTYRKSVELMQELFQPGTAGKASFKRDAGKIFIVGGGKLGTQIALMLKRDFGNVSLRIIDNDRDRCKRLSEEFGDALIINTDGADARTLDEEGIEGAEAYVCATDSDEVNMMYCALAKKMGAKKTIAVVKRKDYQSLIGSIPVDAIVDPNASLANVILKYVRYKNHALAYSMMENIGAEMLEVVLSEDVPLCGKTLAEIKLKKGAVVALIGRKNEVLVPDGSTYLLPGDHVILFALTEMMPETAKLFGAEFLVNGNED